MHCAKHGTAKEAHPYYHDKGIHCAECATEHERRESAKRRQPEQYSRWLVEAANFLAEHNDWFACDCEAYQESDTGAWIHQEEKCASFWEDHIDIVLREAAERIALDTETIGELRGRLSEGEAIVAEGIERMQPLRAIYDIIQSRRAKGGYCLCGFQGPTFHGTGCPVAQYEELDT